MTSPNLASESQSRGVCSACMDAASSPLAIAIAAGLISAAAVVSYLVWCPESPRFNRRPWRREWWKRHGI